MKGYTHALLGVAGAVAVHALHPYLPAGLPGMGVAVICAGVGALLPDVDADESLIRQATGTARHRGLVGLVVSWIMPAHRGLTHSSLAAFAASALAWMFPAYWVIALATGYVSHLAADMLTQGGIPLFWPLSQRRISLLPLTTGGAGEYLIGFAAGMWLWAYTWPSASRIVFGLWANITTLIWR
jgi:inner membrane protein